MLRGKPDKIVVLMESGLVGETGKQINDTIISNSDKMPERKDWGEAMEDVKN